MQLQEQQPFVANRGGYWLKKTGIGVLGIVGYRATRRQVDRSAQTWKLETLGPLDFAGCGRCDWGAGKLVGKEWSEEVCREWSEVEVFVPFFVQEDLTSGARTLLLFGLKRLWSGWGWLIGRYDQGDLGEWGVMRDLRKRGFRANLERGRGFGDFWHNPQV